MAEPYVKYSDIQARILKRQLHAQMMDSLLDHKMSGKYKSVRERQEEQKEREKTEQPITVEQRMQLYASRLERRKTKEAQKEEEGK